jgi:hypothetical protein
MNCIECGSYIESKSFSTKVCSVECASIRQRRQSIEWRKVPRRVIELGAYIKEWNILIGERSYFTAVPFKCLTCNTDGKGNQHQLEVRKSTPCAVCKPRLNYPPNYITSTTPIPRAFLQGLYNRATRNSIQINVDEEYLWQIFLNQNGKCALSDTQLVFEKRNRNNASLDRIDPEKGYIKGNVQWLTIGVNIAKGEFLTEEYIDICTLVAKKAGKIP